MNPLERHLDLGCGKFPRNPYGRRELSGIDIRALQGAAGFDYRVANLGLQPIPHGDSSFGSVSAYDFIEHVPRILATADGRGTRFPFVELMQEIWRVLAPGGRFYALTPGYPYAAAFADPTHVNVITDSTHAYFCGPSPMARMYGFQGRFEALRVQWTHPGDAYSAIPGSPENRAPRTGLKRAASGWRALSRRLRGKAAEELDGTVYLLWELEAVKDAPAA
jgi:SAM-dependent methyltransferase